ncbi:MAG: REP-associated tyrosine transposase, partial [Armatimonadota bacterium]
GVDTNEKPLGGADALVRTRSGGVTVKDDRVRKTTSNPVVTQFQKRKRRLLPRWEAPGELYHVRSSTLPGRPEDLTAPANAEIIREVLHYDDGRRYELHCYVIMPDHFHALLRPLCRGDGAVPLSEIMQAIKSISARRINRLSGACGSLWLDDGYTRMIRCDEEYKETWHYIRCNPIKAGYVDIPEDWACWWSRR